MVAPPHRADEEHLVRLVAKGDRAAFEELYRRTSPWLAVRLRRRCADEQIVAEVMQETYRAVWRAAGAFAGSAAGGTAVGWVWTIAARASSTPSGAGPTTRSRPRGGPAALTVTAAGTAAYAVAGPRR